MLCDYGGATPGAEILLRCDCDTGSTCEPWGSVGVQAAGAAADDEAEEGDRGEASGDCRQGAGQQARVRSGVHGKIQVRRWGACVNGHKPDRRRLPCVRACDSHQARQRAERDACDYSLTCPDSLLLPYHTHTPAWHTHPTHTHAHSGRREHAEDGGERTWDAAVDEEFKVCHTGSDLFVLDRAVVGMV